MRTFVAALVLGGLLASGCAVHQRISLVERSAEQIPDFAKRLGIIFAAQLPRDSDQVHEHFGRDLLAGGILPVEVFLQNLSERDSFHVLTEAISFELIDGEQLQEVTPEEVYEQFKFSQWRSVFPYVCGVVPGVVVAQSVTRANREMLEDYRQQYLGDSPLHARAPRSLLGVRGVKFFRIPEGVGLEELRKGSLWATVIQIDEDSKESEFRLGVLFRHR